MAGREKKFYKNAKFLLTESLSSHTTFFALSDWAIVQLAGRRILAPIIKVRVLVAQPSLAEKLNTSPSSSRPRTPAFHAVNRGSNPLGDANLATITLGSEEDSGVFFIPVAYEKCGEVGMRGA